MDDPQQKSRQERSDRLSALDVELARLSTEPTRVAGWAAVAADLRALEAAVEPRDWAALRLVGALARLAEALRSSGRPAGQAALGLMGEGLHDFDQLTSTHGDAVEREDLTGAMELLMAELAHGPGPDTAFDIRLEAFARREPVRSRRRAAALVTEGAIRLEAVWSGLAEQVRRQGEALGKRVELVTTGGELEVTGPAGEALRPALLQLIRNACTHGVESPAARQGAGKPGLAILRLSARRSGDRVMVTLADDGRGVAADRRSKGSSHPSRDSTMGPGAEMIHAPEAADRRDASARMDAPRAGLDQVRGAVEEAGGEVALNSTPGRGAAFTLSLPAPSQTVSAGSAVSALSHAAPPSGARPTA